jgi:hypothetical protein
MKFRHALKPLAVAAALVAAAWASRPAPAAAPVPAGVAVPDPGVPPVFNTAAGEAVGTPFGPGESLRFSIEYGVIKAGTAWLEVAPMETWHGRTCYHLVSRAESNDFMSSIYKVRDRIDSLIDAEGLYSYRYKKRIREGTYTKDYDVAYDPAAGKARYANGRLYDTSPWPKDGLAAFYFVRHLPLEVGKDVLIAHHSDESSNDIIVKVYRKERVEVPAGKFDCIVIEPVMAAGSIFKNSGKLTIWVTDDARRIPVLMKSKIPVGSIDAVLQEIKPSGPARGGQPPAVSAPVSGL